MTLAIFPTSPLYGGLQRQPYWNENVNVYDSGAHQGNTPFLRPLYRYRMPAANVPRIKQSSLEAFFNDTRGGTTPWLLQDPYSFQAHGAVLLNSGTTVSTFYLFTTQSFQTIAKSGSLLITSTLSGTLPSSWISVVSQDTGLLVRSGAKAAADIWTVASGEFFKKCVFEGFSNTSPIWEMFNIDLSFREIA